MMNTMNATVIRPSVPAGTDRFLNTTEESANQPTPNRSLEDVGYDIISRTLSRDSKTFVEQSRQGMGE